MDPKFIEMFNNPTFSFGLFIVAIWSLIWKGIAMWRAAHNENQKWFVVLLVVNTVGILDMLYLFVFGRKKKVKTT